MKQKLMKIIKSLKNFTFDDIQIMTECNNENLLLETLKELVDLRLIVQVSDKQYSVKKVSSKPVLIKRKFNFKDWLDKNCNGDLNKLTLDTIKPDLFFDKTSEVDLFNKLNPIQKRNVIKYYTLYKATTNSMGKVLYEKVSEISNKYPIFKCTPDTVVSKNREYRLKGLSAFIPKKNYLPPERFSQEVLDKFEELYLSPVQYSYQHCREILSKEYDNVDIPASITMSKYLKRKYSTAYILEKRKEKTNNIYNVIDIKEFTDFKTMKFVDAAHKFMSEKHSEGSFSFLNAHLIPYFKDYELKDITQEVAEEFQNQKISEGYSITSVKCMMNILNNIYKAYVIKNNKPVFRCTKILPIKEQEYLTQTEISKLIEEKSLKLWTICLGILPQELAALNYNDIDFKNKTVLINKIYQKTRFRKYFHLHAIRTLKLHPILMDLLDKNGKGIIYENVDIEDATILLNTHVKLLLEQNVPMNIICKNLGYKNLHSFEMRFNFLFQNQLKDNFNILEKVS